MTQQLKKKKPFEGSLNRVHFEDKCGQLEILATLKQKKKRKQYI